MLNLGGGMAAFVKVYTAPLQSCRATLWSLPRLSWVLSPRQSWRANDYYFSL